MATQKGSEEVDLAQVFKDLARGEQTATAMENRLSQLEQRIDELLASVGNVDGADNRNDHAVAGWSAENPGKV